MKKKLMLTALLVGIMSIGSVYGAYLTYKSFVEITGTKYPLGIVELETIPIAPIEGLEAREDYLGEMRVWTYSDRAQLVLQLVQLSHIVTNFRSFTVKVKMDLDIVFVVDLTGSMMPYMDTVKEKLIELTGVLYMMNKGQVQVSVVGFKDEIVDVLGWTNDYYEIVDYIGKLEAEFGGGIPQSHYLGFETALALFKEKDVSWVHDRVVVFVSDAPPGVDDTFEFEPDGPTVNSVLALAEAGIKVHPVLCGPDELPESVIYRWYADVTGGHFTHGEHRIVPGVTRDPTWIVKLTPVTPFDSFRMPLRSSEPTMKEGFYTFHIYVDFYCKAVPWHEWFQTELTAHLEKAEIPPYFPPPYIPGPRPKISIELGIDPIGGGPECTDLTFDWAIIETPPDVTLPQMVTLQVELPDGTVVKILYQGNNFPDDFTGTAMDHAGTPPLVVGDYVAHVVYDYIYAGVPLWADASHPFSVTEE
jgi:hypothetical protein